MTYVIDYDAPRVPWALDGKLEIAFEARYWSDLEDESLEWTDVTGRAREIGSQVTWERGRQSLLGRNPQVGELKVTVDSADGAFTPDNPDSVFYPNVRRGIALRWSVNAGDGYVRQFTGFVESIAPAPADDLIPDWTQVTLTVVDGLARVNQFGGRWAWRDRILGDLSAAAVSYATSYMAEAGWWPHDPTDDDTWAFVLEDATNSTGAPVSQMVSSAGPAWGFGWWRCAAPSDPIADPNGWESSYGYDWSTPGAAGTLSISGDGDRGDAPALHQPVVWGAAFDNAHMGGRIRQSADGLSFGVGPAESLRQVAAVGRPPEQLFAADTFDHTKSPPWTGRSGGTVEWVDASTLDPDFIPSVRVWDPVAGTFTRVPAGPAWAVKCTLSANNEVFDSPTVTIPSTGRVALQCLGFHQAAGSGGATTLISKLAANFGGSDMSLTAYSVVLNPSGATSVKLTAGNGGLAGTSFYLWGWGAYAGVHEAWSLPGTIPTTVDRWNAVAAWWGPGDSDGLYGWVSARVTDAMRSNMGLPSDAKALHVRFDASAMADGQMHPVGWNLHSAPRVWIDGAPADASWYVSDATADDLTGQITFGFGEQTGLTRIGPGTTRAELLDSAKTQCAGAVTGSDYAGITGPDSDLLVRMWSQGYGGVEAIYTPAGVMPGDYLNGVLDEVGWPAGMRDIAEGTNDYGSRLARDRMPLQHAGNDTGAPNPSVASVLADACTVEQGWCGVDASGHLAFKARRWYDPDRDGITPVDVVLSWTPDIDVGVTPVLTFDALTLGDDDSAPNQVSAAGPDGSGVAATFSDLEDVSCLGEVPGDVLQHDRWQTIADVTDVAAEAFGVSRPGAVLPRTLSLSCAAAQEDKLSLLLGVEESQPVLVRWPRLPADDGEELMLLTQVAYSTDGVQVDLTASLSPLPGTGVPSGLLIYPADDLYPAADLYPLGA